MNTLKFVVKQEIDECPDLSFYGEYTDHPKGADYDKYLVIDREARGDKERNEYRYFVCTHDLKDSRKFLREHGYSKHDAAMLPREYSLQDYERMEDAQRGGWYMTGIVVTLLVNGVEVAQDSLWGIESDLDKDHIEEVVRDCKGMCLNNARKEIDSLRRVRLPKTIEKIDTEWDD